MENSTTCFNKLLQKSSDSSADSKFYFYLQSKWCDDHAEFVIQDTRKQKCYKGRLTCDQMKETAGELDIPFSEFYIECRSALTANIALPNFEYEIDESHTFRLNKIEELTIEYLDIQLKEMQNNYEMLETALMLIETKASETVDKVETTTKIDKEHQEMVEALERCVEDKNQMKRRLMAKFAKLLDSKKQKITELREQLLDTGHECQSDLDEDNNMTDNGPRSSGAGQKKQRRAKALASDSDEDEDFMAATQPLTEKPSTTLLFKRSRLSNGGDGDSNDSRDSNF